MIQSVPLTPSAPSNPSGAEQKMNSRRTRVVNFRVTEREYALLRSASMTLGLSAYARQASLSLAGHTSVDGADPQFGEFLLACLMDLRRRMAELESKLEVLIDGSLTSHHQTCAYASRSGCWVPSSVF